MAITFRTTFEVGFFVGVLLRGAQWLFDLDLTIARLIAVVTLITTITISWRGSRNVDPWTPEDIHDGAIGWGVVAAVAFAVPCMFLPAPWALVMTPLVASVIFLSAVAVERHAEQLGVDAHAPTPSATSAAS